MIQLSWKDSLGRPWHNNQFHLAHSLPKSRKDLWGLIEKEARGPRLVFLLFSRGSFEHPQTMENARGAMYGHPSGNALRYLLNDKANPESMPAGRLLLPAREIRTKNLDSEYRGQPAPSPSLHATWTGVIHVLPSFMLRKLKREIAAWHKKPTWKDNTSLRRH